MKDIRKKLYTEGVSKKDFHSVVLPNSKYDSGLASFQNAGLITPTVAKKSVKKSIDTTLDNRGYLDHAKDAVGNVYHAVGNHPYIAGGGAALGAAGLAGAAYLKHKQKKKGK
jgi:hypothetical protein